MKRATLTAETALQQALHAAETIYQTSADQPCPAAALSLLCELAASEDEAIARAGATGIFPALVERLNDSFEPAACDRYDEVFAQVIEFFRRLPAGNKLDEVLRRFNLLNAADLLARKQRLSTLSNYASGSDVKEGSGSETTVLPYDLAINAASIKKILLLSRVTIGADVAVTSVLLAGLRQRFPQAEFVLLGSAKLRELFGGDTRLRVRELSYERGGTVLARLHSWLAVVEAVEDEARACPADELLVIDPDSRLTQLGLLPVVAADRNYFFFESRRYRHDSNWPLARLTAQWCSEVFGTSAQLYPQLALPQSHQAFGQAVAQRLRRAGQRHLVSLSFGVGGNQDKRVNDEFELELLQELLKDSALLLDKGGAPDERAQINRLLAALRAQCVTVSEINAENAPEMLAAEALPASVVTWDGSIGAFAGLIAASDQYIGYDSAGQHIAAALGVPTLTIFVNANAPRFAARWQPYGVGVTKALSFANSSIISKDYQ
jgi:ADP-heptose:LPS heptosyltransferase